MKSWEIGAGLAVIVGGLFIAYELVKTVKASATSLNNDNQTNTNGVLPAGALTTATTTKTLPDTSPSASTNQTPVSSPSTDATTVANYLVSNGYSSGISNPTGVLPAGALTTATTTYKVVDANNTTVAFANSSGVASQVANNASAQATAKWLSSLGNNYIPSGNAILS